MGLRSNQGSGSSLGGEDAGNTGEVVGDADVRPTGGPEKRLNRWQAVVAQLQNKKAAGLQVPRGFGDESAVEFVAFVSPEKGYFRFVLPDLERQELSFAASDVRRIADDEVEPWREGRSELRVRVLCTLTTAEGFEQVGFEEVDPRSEAVTGGVAASDFEGGFRNIGGVDGGRGKFLR